MNASAATEADVNDVAGRRILVTGGGGFLGTRVCERLGAAGASELIAPRRREVDLTSEVEVKRLMDGIRPDMVVHLAAEVGGIGANRANPGRYFYANMAMGLHLIEAARQHGVGKFVQVGTVCAYPKHAPVPFREASLWDGYPEETNAPYGVAKKALSVMLDGYRAQYGLHGIFVIPVNLYGPGDNFDLQTSHVIPALIRKFATAVERGDQTVDVWGTGAASREFLYVDDAAAGIVAATERYDEPDPVNLGTGQEIVIRDLVELIAKLVGFDGQIVWDTSKPDGQPRRMLDVSRAAERFGFTAQVGLEEGLRRTIDWWRRHDGGVMRDG